MRTKEILCYKGAGHCSAERENHNCRGRYKRWNVGESVNGNWVQAWFSSCHKWDTYWMPAKRHSKISKCYRFWILIESCCTSELLHSLTDILYFISWIYTEAKNFNYSISHVFLYFAFQLRLIMLKVTYSKWCHYTDNFLYI